MKRNWLNRCIAASLFILPLTIFAQATSQTSTDTTDVFGLSLTDPSLTFLGQIFGTVGSLPLVAAGGQLFGNLFKYFNLGILSIAGIFLVWTTVKIIIDTSSEGSFMGRGGKAAFNVIRTVGGIGLLVPSGTTGYSIVQVIVMWAVIQGCGFANTLWNKSLDFFQSGGQLLAPPSPDLQSVVGLAGTVLEAQVCMYYYEKLNVDQKTNAQNMVAAGNTTPLYTQLANSFIPSFVPYIDAKNMIVNFPSSPGNNPTDNGCGSFSWAQPTPANNVTVGQAFLTIIDTQAGVARNIVNPSSSDNTPIGTNTSETPLQDKATTALVTSASEWGSLLIPIRSQAGNTATLTSFFQKARDAGWLYAGSYYYSLTGIQRNLMAATNIKVFVSSPPSCLSSTNGNYFTFQALGVNPQCITAMSKTFQNPHLDIAYLKAAGYVIQAQTLAQTISASFSSTQIAPTLTSSDAGLLQILIAPLTGGMTGVVGVMFGTGDPIIKMQTMGDMMISIVVTCWIVGAIVMFALGIGMSLMSSMLSFGYALTDAASVMIPLLMGLLAVIFVQGATLSIYVPLIPFIVYTFTVLGWFIVVIEAMVAAPLVALGVTHPEGHDLLGKAEQAIMLVLSVFLRPALMVIGLISGMLLSNIMLQVLNFGYGAALTNSLSVWGFIAFLTIYVALAMQMVTQCYALIYLVPDRVMKWIGTGVEGPQGATQALSSAESANTEMAKAGGAFGGAMAQGAGKSGGEAGKQMKESKQSGGGQVSGKGGKSGGGGGG